MATKTRNSVLRHTARQHNNTVQAVAKRAGVTQLTARRHLDALVSENEVEVVGVKMTGKRGRPARLYRRLPAAPDAA